MLVTCVAPLRAYVYHEGLVRLATQPYTLDRCKLRWACVCAISLLASWSAVGLLIGSDSRLEYKQDTN